MAMVTIPKYKVFDGKRYTLERAFLGELRAEQVARDLKKKGFYVRIYKKGGQLHFTNCYNIYSRKR